MKLWRGALVTELTVIFTQKNVNNRVQELICGWLPAVLCAFLFSVLWLHVLSKRHGVYFSCLENKYCHVIICVGHQLLPLRCKFTPTLALGHWPRHSSFPLAGECAALSAEGPQRPCRRTSCSSRPERSACLLLPASAPRAPTVRSAATSTKSLPRAAVPQWPCGPVLASVTSGQSWCAPSMPQASWPWKPPTPPGCPPISLKVSAQWRGASQSSPDARHCMLQTSSHRSMPSKLLPAEAHLYPEDCLQWPSWRGNHGLQAQSSFPLPWAVIPVASSAWALCTHSFPTRVAPDSCYNPPVTGLRSPDGQGSGPAPAGAAGCTSLPSGGLGLQLLQWADPWPYKGPPTSTVLPRGLSQP